MGIMRQFYVSCDKCGAIKSKGETLATNVRTICKTEGWTISGNKFTCPVCNGRDPDYWTDMNAFWIDETWTETPNG